MSALPGTIHAELRVRHATREDGHAARIVRPEDFERRYAILLHMVKELTLNCAQAANASQAAGAKSLLAGKLAATVAQTALAKGFSELSGPAFEAAQAACEAAAHAATSSTQAWTAALVAAGHSADRELLKLSADAGAAARSAGAAAEQALQILEQTRLPSGQLNAGNAARR